MCVSPRWRAASWRSSIRADWTPLNSSQPSGPTPCGEVRTGTRDDSATSTLDDSSSGLVDPSREPAEGLLPRTRWWRG
jgi:hypothetical protein